MKILRKQILVWRIRQENKSLRDENIKLKEDVFNLKNDKYLLDLKRKIERLEDTLSFERERYYKNQEELNKYYDLKDQHTNILASIKILGIKIELDEK